MSKKTKESRREFLSYGASLLAGFPILANADPSKTIKKDIPKLVGNSGTYDTVALKQETVSLCLVQSEVTPVDGKNPKPGIKSNLDHMLFLIDAAQGYGGHKDYLAFHEFPITGWDQWSREEILGFALRLPGPETEAIGKKAIEHNCYISFGTYAQYKDWPRHIMSVSVIINPKGEIISEQWKARNIHGVFVGFELFTTTVYDVLDRYVEMYGWDAVLPVAKTDIGNITITPCVMEPEIFRGMAMKGAELIIKTASGGSNRIDAAAVAQANKVYTGLVNNSVSPNNRSFIEDAGGGGTSIYEPWGKCVAEAETHHEEIVTHTIPMQSFRDGHKTPDIHYELITHLTDQYVSRYGPNGFLKYLPEGLKEAGEYFLKKSRWK
jgi:predicted amidohydrolase